MKTLRLLSLSTALTLCIAFGCPTGTTIVRATCGQMSTPGCSATIAPTTQVATAIEIYILLLFLQRIMWLH